MKTFLGLLLTCLAVPALYAGGLYYLSTRHVFDPKQGDKSGGTLCAPIAALRAHYQLPTN